MISLSIIDIQGKKLQDQQLDTSKNIHTVYIDTLPKGMYFIRVTSTKDVIVKKLLIN
ncbi:T9SS type A sorting domain-containing protein [uncultured Dokdonia sp.]|uniref:T9SS type A sorting domain-containing protein n=1 Tax=uncultured Dokdonia sp. TaxID=575653 RepID=UPI003431F816